MEQKSMMVDINMDQFDKSKFSVVPFQTRVDKPWGFEIIYTPPNAPAVGKILHVNAGKRLSLQYHDEKIETLCCTLGKGLITLTDKDGQQKDVEMEINKGYFVIPGQIHRVTAVTDMEFIESSTPESGNTFRLQDDTNRDTETEEMRNKDRGLS
jgi:mannose-6-phosphate isomerase-like protein (cupin superfamily)